MKKGRILAAIMSIVLAFTAIPVNAQNEDTSGCTVSDQAAVCVDDTEEEGDEEYTTVIDDEEAADYQFNNASTTYEFKYGQTEARKMLERINSFRKSDDAWYWNKENTEKVKAEGLQDYTYDYGLEKIAMTRAIEIAHTWNHTRPNGKDCFSAWEELGYAATGARGENIAYGYASEESVFIGWREDNDNYSGQGHRRNMLSSSFKYIGIGHAIYKGTHYWVQDFGSVATGEAQCDAADSDYKAVFDENGNVKISKAGESSDPEDPKPEDPKPEDPKPEDPEPEEPEPEAPQLSDIVLVTKEKYDLAAALSKVLGNTTVTKYKSEAKSIAAVSKKGIITAKYSKTDAPASTYITAYTSGTGGEQKEAAKIKVTVYKPVFKFTDTDLTYTGMTLNAGSFLSNVPEGKNIKYSVPASKSDMITVNESSGLLTAGEKNGTVKVSVLIGDGDKAAKYTASLKVKKPKLKDEIHIKSGKTKKLTLKNVSSFNIDKIQWKTEGNAVTLNLGAKNNTVKIGAAAGGEAVVTATLNGMEYKTRVYVE